MALNEAEKELVRWVRTTSVGQVGTMDQDFDKQFAGTKMDTILELAMSDLMRGRDGTKAMVGPDDGSAMGKEAMSDLMRGRDGTEVMDKGFCRRPCTCSISEDGEHGSGCPGRWLKTMNCSGTCYLLSQILFLGLQPGARARAGDGARAGASDRAPYGSAMEFLRGCCWPFAGYFRRRRQGGGFLFWHAPLLGYRPSTAKDYDCITKFAEELVRAPLLLLPQPRTGIKFEVIDVEDSSPHFLDKLCNNPKYRSKFPEQVFNPRAQAWIKSLIYAPPKEGFAPVLLTTLNPQEHESELKDKLPWQFIKPMRITTFIPATYIYLYDLASPATYIYLYDLARTLEGTKGTPLILDLTSDNKDPAGYPEPTLDPKSDVRQQGGHIWTLEGTKGTPLILDLTSDNKVDTFLAYQRTQLIDVGQLTSSARSVEEMREVFRSKLVSAMKAGDVLLLKLKDGRGRRRSRRVVPVDERGREGGAAWAKGAEGGLCGKRACGGVARRPSLLARMGSPGPALTGDAQRECVQGRPGAVFETASLSGVRSPRATPVKQI
eukprot:gene31685-6889_t